MLRQTYTVIENEWITLKDGTRLAARTWMPEGAAASPVPAVLEFLPYRKRGGTEPRDESTYPVFAAAGIAGVRVDIRGSGESDGVIDGEYTPRELSDACEIIGWIAAQPWSNGNVGMMGISWGGFNCLQVGALGPPALKAVISIASTVDRYNDDIHYKNGCHLSAHLSWAATMLAYQSRPPDPEIVGESWREMWLERLENEPFFMEEWIEHQRRDAFWKHGSICEDFDAFPIPALVIAGWADGYRNTPVKAVEGLGAKARALIGPWVHKYPHFAWPKPRADFHSEAIAWWNRWLRDEPKNSVEDLPQMRAYILDGPRPALRREQEPGYWVAKQQWTKPESEIFGVDARGALTAEGGAGIGEVYIRSPLDTGTAAGQWWTLKPDAEMAGDQRIDDAGSLVFETERLEAERVYLGQPQLKLGVRCEGEWANLVARIIDVHPDGTATRVAYGVLNLAHREGNAEPSTMEKGERTAVTMVLDACGYCFARGHCIRLSLSTAYWPLILPAPEDPGLTIDTASLLLALPLLGAHEKITLPEPENRDPLPDYIDHLPGESRRSVERDLIGGTTLYRIYEDTGLSEHPANHLSTREILDEVWSLKSGDPQSMTGSCSWSCYLQRSGWSVRTEITSQLSCTASEWLVTASVTAYEEERRIFHKTYDKRIARDFM
ncbi:CocE/NonD family hydrolase [Mesorhizobium sp. WSM3626]|uniref:CocE/NonD family hydrolase n=1 Tax=Mesorhizobium sp. WSM3626 TaxID=1040987 RepID=UPI0004831D3C|nr:CocE/NonD family hydrolase [Mesorhizobium sp. WSM3626]